MRKFFLMRGIIFIFLLLTVACFSFWRYNQRQSGDFSADLPKNNDSKTNMKITSPVLNQDQKIPEVYTCDGEKTNPPLEFSQVPKNAESLVLIVDDPDAPSGLFIHWTIWNIDPKAGGIGQGSVPGGAIEGNTTVGKPGYVPPCPPSGSHRYYFKLYALDKVLDLEQGASIKDLESAIEGHIIDRAELMARYR